MSHLVRFVLMTICLSLEVYGNIEGEALYALKSTLVDPSGYLQNWDPTLASPCTWFHVQCNNDSVTRVDLGNSNLSGRLVRRLGELKNLEYLELYNNNISGRIPAELGNLTALVSLDLYMNNLNGSIPDSFGKLKKLRFLRLNNNSLSGNIPYSLTEIPALTILDLSSNKLTGDIPVNGSFASFTPVSFENNPLNVSLLTLPPVSPSVPASPSGNGATFAIAGGVAAGAALLFAAPAIAFVWWRHRKPEADFFDVAAEEDPEVHLGQLKRFSLRELQVASDYFSEKNILGKGGFGKVYKGRLTDGSLVAIKRLKEERTNGGELQFQTEVELISMAVHRNLLRLLGFCMTPTERLLVYPLMVNGSVASCLKGKSSEKTDVFGYGVMLLELITGKKAFDLAQLGHDDDILLLDWVKGILKDKKLEMFVDADMQGDYIEEEMEQLIQVALLCTLASPLERPKMSEVVRMLEGDGLTDRWEELQKKEMVRQEFNRNNHHHYHRRNTIRTFDSTSILPNDDLSGPR